MNYETIEDIISSGTTNMTQLRNNSKQDDGEDTVTGVDWFKFRGNVTSNVYASGNSWISFGTNSENYSLKVNRRDAAMWNLWREEGTLRISTNKFLRIRWDGYSRYSQTSASYHLTFDVILLVNGDIVLNIVTWPTSYADGTNQLMASTAVSYTPSSSALQFTFLHQDTDGNNFTVQSGIIDNLPAGYHLLADVNDVVYTITDVNSQYTLQQLTGVTPSTLTASIFQSDGFMFMPPSDILKTMSSPKIYTWDDTKQRNAIVTVEAVPVPQDIITQIDLSPVYITGIDSVLASYTLNTGTINVSYSYDGTTYTTAVPIADFLLLNFGTVYSGLGQSKQLYIKFTISGDATLTSFQMNYVRRTFTP